MRFEWDLEKEKENRKKHKITFTEACYVFADKSMLTIFDLEHSSDEERWITMGQTPEGKILTVVHTYKKVAGLEHVRIISARKATKSEEKQYFERRINK
jgi:uncharacterized DUF497 family protein